MPKENGVEILRAIRQSERFAAMPVVVSSSSPDSASRPILADLHVIQYITKPSELDEFLKIGSILEQILLGKRDERASPQGI